MAAIYGKYLTFDDVTGYYTLTGAIEASSGATDAGKIPKLSANGRLPLSMMAPEVNNLIGGTATNYPTTDDLTAGALVTFYQDTTDANTWKVRLADAEAGRPARGFVNSAVAAGADVEVRTQPGAIANLTLPALPAGSNGTLFLGPSGGILTVPSFADTTTILQSVGFMMSDGTIFFDPDVNPTILR